MTFVIDRTLHINICKLKEYENCQDSSNSRCEGLHLLPLLLLLHLHHVVKELLWLGSSLPILKIEICLGDPGYVPPD